MMMWNCSPARSRLLTDFRRIHKKPMNGITVKPSRETIMVWNAVICGLRDTAFANGIFKLTLEFTEDYPGDPPVVRFQSKIFHPNIRRDGRAYFDILTNKWNRTHDVTSILTTIQSLLSKPNLNSPANYVAAQIYKYDRFEYNNRVRECVLQSLTDLGTTT